jgi:Tfp pilus assembly protein PilE
MMRKGFEPLGCSQDVMSGGSFRDPYDCCSKEDNQKVRLGKNQKGLTMIELIVIVVIMVILGAVAITRYVNLSRNASDGTARWVLGALRTQNAFMFSERIFGRTTASYTMRSIARNLGELKGIQWTASSTTFTMTLGRISYRFTLNPIPRAPTTFGSITAGTGTFATW